MSPMKLYRPLLLLTVVTLAATGALAQKKIISGIVKDSHSDERIPFASISFKNSTVGKLSDSSGAFSFYLNNWPSDTLEITCVGYQPFRFGINKAKDSILVNVILE